MWLSNFCVFTVLYHGLALVGIRFANTECPTSYFKGGAKMWRCLLGCIVQFAFFPLVWLADDRTAFMCTFPLFILSDFWLCHPMKLPLTIHHTVCTVSHMVTLHYPETFESYWTASTLLEIGSGFCNLYCLRPSYSSAANYYLAISCSNIACVVLAVRWIRDSGQGMLLRAAGALISCGIVLGRQREAKKAFYFESKRTSCQSSSEW